MDSISLNIAILPDEKTSQLAIALSQSLAKVVPAKFVLNSANPIPHITLYQAEFPVKNFARIEQEISKIAHSLRVFEMQLESFSATRQGTIWWNCKDFQKIQKLQTEIIEKCNTLREGELLPLLKTYRSLNQQQEDEIKTYGSLWIGKRYLPHISISGADDIYIEKALAALEKRKQASFLVDGIIIGKLGDYGTVTEIIKIFNFPS